MDLEPGRAPRARELPPQPRSEKERAWNDLKDELHSDYEVKLWGRFFGHFSSLMVQFVQVFHAFTDNRVGVVGRPQPGVSSTADPMTPVERSVISVDPSLGANDVPLGGGEFATR